MALQFQNYTFLGDKFGTGGINLKWADTNLEDNESPNCKNVMMTRRGAITTRTGYVKLNASPVANYPTCLGIYEYRQSNGTRIVISAFDEFLFSGVGTLTPFVTGRDTSAWDYFTTLNNVCIVTNGVDNNMYYDGVNDFTLGITPPVAAPTFVSNVGAPGAVDVGNHLYVYTYVNAMGGESNPSPVSAVMTEGGNGRINLAGITDSPDPQASYVGGVKNLYRTQAGNQYYYFLDTVPNGTATYSDVTADVNLGYEIEYDKDVPPKFL
jgi:hypothetical protein